MTLKNANTYTHKYNTIVRVGQCIRETMYPLQMCVALISLIIILLIVLLINVGLNEDMANALNKVPTSYMDEVLRRHSMGAKG